MAAQNQILTLAEGVGVGAGLTYFLDPQSGGARRAKVIDKVIHGRKKAGRFAKGVRVDLSERKKGMIPKFRQATRLGSLEEVEDRVLAERVRAKIGKHVTHAGSLNVEAADGKVALSGPILAEEVEEALKVVRHVPGVKDVENRLEVHADADGVPGLQGPSKRSHEKPEILKTYWSPSFRLIMGLFGVWLMATGTKLFGTPRVLMLGTGSALLIRSWRNRPFFRGLKSPGVGGKTGRSSRPEA